MIMNNNELQILTGSALGDGHITPNGTFTTGSKHKEWIDYKANILSKYTTDKWYNFIEKNGYNQTPYHTLRTSVNDDIRLILSMSLKEKLDTLDELGLAIWFYDDGSFHQIDMRYHLYTNSFTEEEHIRYILPALMRFGIKAGIAKDRKQDGRVFYYTTIGKKTGAQIVNKALKKVPVKCYKYKTYHGNINDTLRNKFVKTTNVNTGKIIIHDSINVTRKYLKTHQEKIKKLIILNQVFKGHLIEYYYYE